jgi:putative nucleotidyltransferase with HDIG domain
MMTGEPTVETAVEAVRAGAADYLTKPVPREAVLRAVANAAKVKVLDDERRRLSEENEAYRKNLEEMVERRTRQLEEALQNWKNATDGTIMAVASAVEARDPYTAGHQRRVSRLALAIASELGFSVEETNAVYYAGIVHDLGKIAVPAEILTHPGKLCYEAMGLIRKHPASGHTILKQVTFPWPIAEIVLQHHERLDGSGYPQGLSGDRIGREARILAVADVVEAMASHRPYRAAVGIDAALGEIEKGRGVIYDAAAVDACVTLFRAKGFTFDTADNGSKSAGTHPIPPAPVAP